MSTLNLALQNVSLARSEMQPEFEAQVNTLQEVQDAIKKAPTLNENLRDSMSRPIVQACSRF